MRRAEEENETGRGIVVCVTSALTVTFGNADSYEEIELVIEAERNNLDLTW